MNLDKFLNKSYHVPSKVVIRLRTTHWSSKRGIHSRKDLELLKRKSFGFNVVAEDVSMVGVKEVIPRIINLDSCEDGIYEVITCNGSKDWETGYVDDYDYKLIKYEN